MFTDFVITLSVEMIIIEKFTAWQVTESTLNFTRKTDIGLLMNKFVISKVFFPSTICTFIFTIATIFSRDSHQQYLFLHECNSTLNTLTSIANQTAGWPLAMRFYNILSGFTITTCITSLQKLFHDFASTKEQYDTSCLDRSSTVSLRH